MADNAIAKVRANLLLLGRTGNGKSEFVNFVLGEHVAETGCGVPVTQEFDRYEYVLKDGLPITIFDSKGLEVDQLDLITENIRAFIQKKNSSPSLNEWFHAVFYFINSGRARLENYEKELIRNIGKITKQPVYTVLTHCYENITETESELTDIIHTIDSAADTVFRINMIEKTDRLKRTKKVFGRAEIEKALPDILWENTARKLADTYASNLCGGLRETIDNLEEQKLLCIAEHDGLVLQAVPEMIQEEFEKKAGPIIREFFKTQKQDLDRMSDDFNELYFSLIRELDSNITEKIEPAALTSHVFSDQIYESVMTIAKATLDSKMNSDTLHEILNEIKKTLFPKRYYPEYYQKLEILFYDGLRRWIPSANVISQSVYEALKTQRKNSLSSIAKKKRKTPNNHTFTD